MRLRLRILAAGTALVLAAIVTLSFYIAEAPLPLASWWRHPWASFLLARGENPSPIRLRRPAAAPLSALAELGRAIFFDPALSGSGRIACATCHDPAHAYGPNFSDPVAMGGPDGTTPGLRAVPSLMYLERVPGFSIGPDAESDDDAAPSLAQQLASAGERARGVKTATATAASAANPVPQGGLFWDGRDDTLQSQALAPLLADFEMDGGSIARVAAKLRAAPYASRFVALFGPAVLDDAPRLVAEAMSALARFEVEDESFHPYSSRYDAWLEGKARFTPAELRGYLAFGDPRRGNCAACHLDQPSPDGLPPLFTDHQYEALGAPRNPAIPANRDPAYADLGLCGPLRADLAGQRGLCGLFATPTLRNAATRRVFFHNGVFRTLRQVLDFYVFRDIDPARIAIPRDAAPFDDLPAAMRANIDRADPPLDRHPGDAPALSAAEEEDMIAFLRTLVDRGQNPAP